MLAQKQQQWKETITAEEEAAPVISMSKKSTLLRWVAYAAAACLLLTVSVSLFEAQTSTKKLADNYLTTYKPEVTMDASRDSLQLGAAAYKEGDYNKALSFFEGVAKRDSSNSDAKKYTGITYLQLNNYDQALQQFNDLANMKDLQYNSGDFLKAVTLLERNKENDKETAKALLNKVVTENESEKEKAAEWLKKF